MELLLLLLENADAIDCPIFEKKLETPENALEEFLEFEGAAQTFPPCCDSSQDISVLSCFKLQMDRAN